MTPTSTDGLCVRHWEEGGESHQSLRGSAACPNDETDRAIWMPSEWIQRLSCPGQATSAILTFYLNDGEIRFLDT